MNENDPIQLLMDEHKIISATQRLINDAKGEWENNEEQYTTRIEQLLKFFREYSDGFHHNKEEKVLFPALARHPEFMQQELLDALEEHHERFRDYAREINQALKDKEWVKSYDILQRYISNLRNHIAVEDSELFVTAENLFSESESERIFFMFKDIDAELGETVKQELEDIVGK